MSVPQPGSFIPQERTLARFAADTPLDVLLEALQREGVIVIDQAAPPEMVAQIEAELEPWFEAAETGAGAFFGKGTRRFSGLFSKSVSSSLLAEYPQVLALAETALKGDGEQPLCDVIDLNLTQAIAIQPGEPTQFLHRDEELWPFQRTFEVMVNVMWAFDDFTVENGATRLIPGSHQWPRTREPEAGEAIAAVAPKGSAIVWLGGVLHGGGANTSADIRRGVIISYKLGWLAPAEKLLLSIEPSIARQLSPQVQRLLGYQIHKPNLGWVEGCDPALWLDGKIGKLAKIQDNLTPGHEALLQDVEANPDRYIGYTA